MVLVLALGLMCTAWALAASSGPMTGVNGTSEVVEAAAADLSVVVTAAAGVSSQSPVMASMCGGPCVGATSNVVCAGAAGLVVGLVVATVLVLFLATRRRTYLGLVARIRRSGLAERRPPGRQPWVVLRPGDLCIWRV